MDFEINNTQYELYESIIDFFKTQINPKLDEKFSRNLWNDCADFGLFSLFVPSEYGGLGESYLTAAIAMIAIGYACKDSGFTFAINNHLWACLATILSCGNLSQKNKFLPPLINGESIGAFAVTEPEAGSDTLNIKTFAEKVENGFIINGRKSFISNAPISDIMVVITKTNRVKNIGGLTAFIVPTDLKGIILEKNTEKMGLNLCPMADVVFNDCFVSEKNILGKVGSGINVLNTALELERCFEFASHIGAMEKIMDLCIGYSKQRKQFDKSINNYQAVSHKISDMKVKIELSKLLLYKIAATKDKNIHSYMDTSIFKLFVSESYIKTCLDALQIWGAYGYAKDSSIEQEIRCALSSTIYAGTSEIQRNAIFKLLSATKG